MSGSKSKRSKKRRNRRKDTRRSTRPPKLSERIWEVAGESIASGETVEEKQNLLNAATSAWNIACSPALQRQRAIREYAEVFRRTNPDAIEEDLAEVREELQTLVANKLRLFPNDRRRIIGARLNPLDDAHVYIEVASARDE